MNALPSFGTYGNYSSENYGAHTLCFTDSQGRDWYFSYKTLVAVRAPSCGLVVRENVWGPTTGKHLNWIDDGNKRERVTGERFAEIVASIAGAE